MSWKQIREFDLSKMGTKKGWCLQNVRLAFNIDPKYNNAKEAMEANANAGTLHNMDTLPSNVAVPVFVDSPSIDEHVEVSDCNVFYSDGERLTANQIKNQKYFGWGETLNDVRIVDFVEDPEPEPTPEPTPEPETKVYYTYEQGDTFGQVLKDLGLDEGNLWGDSGTVKYYTDQLWATQPDVFDVNGNIKVGVQFYLIPR